MNPTRGVLSKKTAEKDTSFRTYSIQNKKTGGVLSKKTAVKGTVFHTYSARDVPSNATRGVLSTKTQEKPRALSRKFQLTNEFSIYLKRDSEPQKALRVTTPPAEGIVDSGATAHFIPMSHKGTNEQNTPKGEGITVRVANGGTMESIATDELDLPAQRSH